MLVVQFISKTASLVLDAEVVYLIAKTLEDGFRQKQNLIWLTIILVLAMLMQAVRTQSRSSATNRVFMTLQERYADKILDADYDMFTEISCSKVISANEQIWNIASIGPMIINMLMQVVSICIVFVYMYRISPALIPPVIILYVIGGVIIKFVFNMYAHIDTESDAIVRDRNEELSECVNGFIEVRSFQTQEHHRASLAKRCHKLYRNKTRKRKYNTFVNGVITAVASLGELLVVLYSIHHISAGTLTVASAMALVNYVGRVIDPIVGMCEYMDALSTDLARLSTYDEVISYKNKEHWNETIDIDTMHNGIEFKDVSFGYGTDNAVLENVNLKIQKGKRTGICGPSGGGKTTLIKLLEKFYVPESGALLIDGVNYMQVTQKSLHRLIGVVHQDNIIFNASIYANIAYGNLRCGKRHVIEAARKANILEFVESLPDGFDTMVGPRGLKLSGGQKQRIALARLFLKDPEIIILDEATSALDNTSETLIQEALEQFKGKTIITIAHRLSTIRDSDIIYVISDHNVQESGTHEELMAQGGLYYRLQK